MNTTDKVKKVQILIQSYEDKKLTSEFVITEIESLTGKKITQDALELYWTGSNIDDFVDMLCIEEIKQWKDISSDQALELINEIRLNSSIAIESRNGLALSRR